MSELLFISDIKQDAATQPRTKMDMAVIDEYAEGMKGLADSRINSIHVDAKITNQPLYQLS